MGWEGLLCDVRWRRAEAVAVSAATMEGMGTLRQRMLDAVFDKAAFPSFGQAQPNTYHLGSATAFYMCLMFTPDFPAISHIPRVNGA